ncbi:MAG: TlpA family protein disulfide reductase [Candidatus Thorarchaeota archaeon]
MKSKVLIQATTVAVLVIFGFLFGIMYMQNTGNWPTDSHNIQLETDLGAQQIELPDWSMTLSDNSEISLHDLRGQTVIVELMATWCSSCETQIAYLEELLSIRTEGVMIIALSVDISETTQMMADYKSDHEFEWDCGVEVQSSFSEYLNVEYIPTIAIIDSNGYLRWVHVGTWSASSMDSTLSSMGL